MLTDLFGWVRQIIYLLIFLTMVLQILPDGSYRKYVKFFAGLVFVVTLLGPVVSLFVDGDWENMLLEAVTESGAWEEPEYPDFDEISENGLEIYEKYASEMAEDLENE